MRLLRVWSAWRYCISAEMSVSSDIHRTALLGMSLKKEADETLFFELALRGYDLSKLRDEESTAEIIKLA